MFTEAVIDKMGESREILGRDSELIPPIHSIYYRILDTSLSAIGYKRVFASDERDLDRNCEAYGWQVNGEFFTASSTRLVGDIT